MSLNTLIAELEEALKAATPEPWVVSVMNNKDVEGGEPFDYNGFRRLVSDSYTGANDGSEEANARLIALMRNSLPALIEAVKRQGEALAPFAKAGQWYTPKEAEYEIGGMIKVADLFAARAALKEPTDD